VWRAAQVHRENHPANEVQLSTLLSIKTGGCVEDCGYCSQSVKADSGVKPTKLMEVQSVLQAAARAKDNGSSRFCMGAAWRNPKDRDMPAIIEMVKGVRGMGLETCMTLGMLTDHQADMLAEAGLDYYNHNIDTSPERYNDIITTRTMEDRLDTLGQVRRHQCVQRRHRGHGRDARGSRWLRPYAGHTAQPSAERAGECSGAGEGHGAGDMLADTPLAKIDDIEFVRTVAVARITMPLSMVRLSAGRESMSEMTQAMCFMAGANSIFTGDTLLTAPNAGDDKDGAMFARLGIKPMAITQTQADLDAERMPHGCAKLEAAE
jgi:biotin synthase